MNNKISEAPLQQIQNSILEDTKTLLLGLSLFMSKFQLSYMQKINIAALPKNYFDLISFSIRFYKKTFAEEWLGCHSKIQFISLQRIGLAAIKKTYCCFNNSEIA
jgi:hypothetical protein